jgi:serine/threonine protein kinase
MQKIGEKYNRIQLIGQGTCGRVYLCQDSTTGFHYAVKVDSSENRSMLQNERRILDKLKNLSGVPRLIDFGDEEDFSYIVIQLLGQSLEDKFIESGRKFPFEDFLNYARQMIMILEGIHERGVIHRDLKPRQVLIGPESNRSAVFIIDFGISMVFREGKHLEFSENCGFAGTSNYCSVYTHKGFQQSRRDDLETFCYVLAYFYTGTLPWIKANTSTANICMVKEKISGKELFGSAAKELIDVFKYVKQLKFQDDVDYFYVREKILDLGRKFQKDNRIVKQYSLMPVSKPKKVKKKFTFIEDTEDIMLNLDSTIVTKGPEINRDILRLNISEN